MMMPPVGKSGPFTYCINVLRRRIGMVDTINRGLNDFVKVVRRNGSRIAGRNTGNTIDEQIRISCRKNGRLHFFIGKVWRPVDGFRGRCPA